MAIYRHTEEEIQEYYEHIGINQSSLKTIIIKGIEAFIVERDQLLRQEELYYEEKKHFVIGSAVDCILTQGTETFNKKYHHIELKKKPSDAVMSIVKMTFDKVREEGVQLEDIKPFTFYRKHICDAADAHDYYVKTRKAPTDKQKKEEEAKKKADPTYELIQDWWNYDTRYTSMKYAEEYWAELIKADGKQILTDDEYNLISAVVMSFRTHKHTRHLFSDDASIDIVYQFPMYWTIDGEDCKGLVDHIRIDHNKKRIMQLDEKTTGFYITTFGKTIESRRYDFQGSWYTHGLKKNLDKLSDLIGIDVKDYTVANFAFVVESTIKTGVPLIFVLTNELMAQGAYGNKEKEILGWSDAFEVYKQWKQIDFSLDTKFSDTNGIVWVTEDYKIREL